MKRWIKNQMVLFALITGVLCTPVICHAEEEAMLTPVYGKDIADGVYGVEVESSSSMFRVVEAQLTVTDGSMTAELTLSGKGYLQLFMGTGEEAKQAEEKEYIPYTENAEGAYVYTIPVEVLNQEFDCAAYSKRKEKWYDRQLMIPVTSLPEEAVLTERNPVEIDAEDGDYTIEATLGGGSGKADIASPVQLRISDNTAVARLEWSSPNYDYMIVGGQKYLPVNTKGNSVFEIPVLALDEEVTVIADTVAMSKPHEIEYTLIFYGDTLQKETDAEVCVESAPETVKAAGAVVVLILVAGTAFIGYRRKSERK